MSKKDRAIKELAQAYDEARAQPQPSAKDILANYGICYLPPKPAPEPQFAPDRRELFSVGQRVCVDERTSDIYSQKVAFGVVTQIENSEYVGHMPVEVRFSDWNEGNWPMEYSITPVNFVPGDLVSHPDHGEGFVYEGIEGDLFVRWPSNKQQPAKSSGLAKIADRLTLVRRAPWSVVSE